MFLFKIFLLAFGLISFAQGEEYKSLKPKPPRNCATILCLDVEQPVKATRGGKCQKFPNSCILDVENCFEKQKGSRELWTIVERCPPKCPEVCPLFFSPLCATNGCILKTFSNPCFLTVYNCQNEENFKYIHEGECGELKIEG